MIRPLRVLVAAACVAAFSCSGPTAEPQLSVTARPNSINNAGQVAELMVAAIDGLGQPGKGSVRVTSTAGSLVDGTVVLLTGGMTTAQFSCDVARDANCRSSIRITAEWTLDGKRVEAIGSVRILTPDSGSMMGDDAGTDAGSDGGARDGGVRDAGSMDAGFDAGVDAGIDAGRALDAGPYVFDGGSGEAYDLRLVVLNANQRLLLSAVAGSPAGQDSTPFQVRVETNTSPAVVVPDASVDFTSVTGTVAPPQAITDDQGRGGTVVSVGTSTPATGLVVEARVGANFVRQLFKVTRAQAIRLSGMAPSRLSIASSASNTSAMLSFLVVDDNGLPIPGVEVVFDLDTASPAGMSVTPARASTNAMGLVSVTLNTGLNTGIAKVRASVPLARLEVVSQGIEIVSGRPYDDRLALSCTRKSLGTLQATPPPRMVSAATQTLCQLRFADVQGNAPPTQQAVRWFSEEGQFDNVVPAAPNSGVASVTYLASTFNFPDSTTPLLGEPSIGSANPRDGLVAIVAAIEGEESFVDGTADGGFNGKWDPGEWFVDLGEPYADSNDNGRFDNGEVFSNVPQYNCITGQLITPENSGYDGPNGCRDERTLIWRTTHVMLTGGPSLLTVTPPFPAQVAAETTTRYQLTLTDSNLNRISADGISAMAMGVGNPRGMLTVSGLDFSVESLGHEILYETFRVRETSPGVFVNEGPCNNQGSPVFPQQRCTRGYRFGLWRVAPVSAQATLTAPAAQAALPDGGVAPNTTSTWDIAIGNSLSTGLRRTVSVQMP